jgi:hypothetical protein
LLVCGVLGGFVAGAKWDDEGCWCDLSMRSSERSRLEKYVISDMAMICDNLSIDEIQHEQGICP